MELEEIIVPIYFAVRLLHPQNWPSECINVKIAPNNFAISAGSEIQELTYYTTCKTFEKSKKILLNVN